MDIDDLINSLVGGQSNGTGGQPVPSSVPLPVRRADALQAGAPAMPQQAMPQQAMGQPAAGQAQGRPFNFSDFFLAAMKGAASGDGTAPPGLAFAKGAAGAAGSYRDLIDKARKNEWALEDREAAKKSKSSSAKRRALLDKLREAKEKRKAKAAKLSNAVKVSNILKNLQKTGTEFTADNRASLINSLIRKDTDFNEATKMVDEYTSAGKQSKKLKVKEGTGSEKDPIRYNPKVGREKIISEVKKLPRGTKFVNPSTGQIVTKD